MTQFIDECFRLAFDMLLVRRLVDGRACGAICKLCDTSVDNVVNIERDGSNSNCFSAA